MPLGVGGAAMRRRPAASVPFSFEVLITHNDGDGWEAKSTGAVTLNDISIAINQNRLHGFFFEDEEMVIPTGSTIETAVMRLKSTAINSAANVVTVFVEDAATPVIFTTTTDDMSDRPLTTASAEWTIPAWGANEWGAGTETPSLVAMLQEVVDTTGIDGAVVVILRGDSSSGNRTTYGLDSGSGDAFPARLTITGTT